MLDTFMGNIAATVFSILSSIRFIDVLDMAVVTFAVYKIIQYLRKSRAM